MSVLSKALVGSLFVLLSAVLFTALLPLVFSVLISFYSYSLPPPQPPNLSADEVEVQKPDPKIDFQPETPTPKPPPTWPFSSAENFLMTSWVSITAGLSVSVTATILLVIGRMTRRLMLQGDYTSAASPKSFVINSLL